MAQNYDRERVDQLPFGTPEKSARYATERYRGAVGLNWWQCDPTLQFIVRSQLDADELAWAEPHLDSLGALMGGPVAERAEQTDRNPPRLVRYDRWGHDISEVQLPQSFLDTRRDVLAQSFNANAEMRAEVTRRVRRREVLSGAWSYMLCQAEIGMTCALGTGGDMVVNLVRDFAPEDVRDAVLEKFASGEWGGESAQSLTERTGGSDLAQIETTATPDGDAWRLNGMKWFVSNANAAAWVVLAKPEGAPDTGRGITTFLVLRERRDGSRNGIRIRRLKDKLGTKAVASAEVEFVDAEAFILSGQASEGAGSGDGKGLARMMAMTNGARLGIAMMGVGCARRSLVESLCYTRARDAFGKPLIEHPLMQRKLAELIVEVEAAQALVFDGYGSLQSLRIGAPLIKLRAARLGITAAIRRRGDPRRQRLRRGLARRPHPARRAGQHHLGRARQHPVPRRAPRHRARPSRRRLPRAPRRGARPRRRRTTRRRRWSASAPSSSRRRSPRGSAWTASPPRRGCSHWRSSWSTSTPSPSCSSRRATSSASSAPTARR